MENVQKTNFEINNSLTMYSLSMVPYNSTAAENTYKLKIFFKKKKPQLG